MLPHSAKPFSCISEQPHKT